jgi:translation initiation factor IF-2
MPRTAKDVDGVPLVSVLEVAARAGVTTEAIRARLNGEIVPNWAGEPSVPASAARRVVEEVEAERGEHARAEAERQALERAEQVRRQARYEQLLEEELAKEAARVMEELRRSNVTVIAMTPPLSPADRAQAAERARQRLNAERK